MSDGETSGVDLARVALRAAMEAARKNGNGQKAKSKPWPVRTVRRNGREPMGLKAAIGALVTERAWELPAAGASLRERWAAIAPELAGHVAAVSYDPDSGRLTVCPESTAWATQARLEQTRVIAAANKAAGRTVVSALRILPPGAAPVPGPADAVPVFPAPAAPAGPARTRETACEGYRRALAVHRATWTRQQHTNPKIQAAAERQLRERLREPEEAFADGRQAMEELRTKAATQQRTRSSDAARARALQRLSAERAGLSTITPAVAPDCLKRTA